jgi:hypothetical protein
MKLDFLYDLHKIFDLTWLDDIEYNPNLTWQFILEHPDINWSYEKLSYNPCITLDIICQNPDKDWSYYGLVQNPSLTFDMLCSLQNIIDKEFDISLFIRYLDWDIISKNINININQNNCFYISNNKSITWKIICDNSNIKWDYGALSKNPNITIDIISNNLDRDWDYYEISKTVKISYNDIEKYKIKWDYDGLLQNPYMEESDLLKILPYAELKHLILRNPNIQLCHFKKHILLKFIFDDQKRYPFTITI